MRPTTALANIAGVITMLSACSNPAVDPDQSQHQGYRFASFNIAMGMPEPGGMVAALQSGSDARLTSLAIVLQEVRPDVVLLVEFDYDPLFDAAALLQRNYLGVSQEGREPISYAYAYRPEVNTGVDSGLDLDGNGALHEPADAWGFGTFPGQYGMMLMSRFPIDVSGIRSFRMFHWSDLPEARRPILENGDPYYSDAIWPQLRLSSKNHLDIPVYVGGRTLHLLISHPTPPVFDGPEDRNGKRNHDELAFWARYLSEPESAWLVDDNGRQGGLEKGSAFLLMGDLNADPVDGDGIPGAIGQLLAHPAIDSSCTPRSSGGAEATRLQGGINVSHRGDPATDTSDFGDEKTGNYRLDYLLPSRSLEPLDCGVFWPEQASPLHTAATFSDHRLVWIDLGL